MFETYNGYGNNVFIDNVSIDGTLIGTEDNPASPSEIVLYPNPTKGILNIDLSTADGESLVQIFDISGVTVLKGNLKPELEMMDLKELPDGIYLIEILNEKFHNTKKVIKK